MIAEKQIPKLCECGCGRPTKRVERNISREGIKKGQYRRFIKNHHNRVMGLRKSGGFKHHGYVYIYSPNHPNPTQGKYVKRSRLVMEKKLGRYLNSSEHIHHINGIRDDDREENLELTTLAGHNRAHQKAQTMIKYRWPNASRNTA